MALEQLECRITPAITIQFDYRRDLTNFFTTNPLATTILEAAASELTARLNDSLLAIAPSENNIWTAIFPDPATEGQNFEIDGLDVPADTLIVFAGARQLGGTTAGIAGPGGFSVSESFFDTVAARGQAGALGPDNTQTDFGPWGGYIAFDIDTPWFFGLDTVGLDNDEQDFHSVALHELAHVLGFGTADSWQNRVSESSFLGPAALDQFGGPVPTDRPAPNAGHWQEGIVHDMTPTAMDPILLQGQRITFTELDFAGLADLGWQVSNLGSNQPPIVANDMLPSIPFNSGTILIPFSDVLANDRPGPDNESGQTLTVSDVGTAQRGTVSTLGTNIVFTPAAGASGLASFTYTATDDGTSSGQSDPMSASATVSFNINAPPPPQAGADNATVAQGSSDNALGVLLNDQDPSGGNLSIQLVGSAANGSTALSADRQQVLYTPAAGFHGSDTFSYTVQSSNGGTATAQVAVTVTPAPPRASNDTAAVVQATADNALLVLANDQDPSGGSLSVQSAGPAANGTTAVAADGLAVLYTPAASFFGTDSFTYTVRSSNGGSASAQVDVTITPAPPAAANDAPSVAQGSVDNSLAVLDNDQDPSGGTLSIEAVANAGNGSATIAGDSRSIVYTPAAGFFGNDSFTYTVRSTNGGSASAQVTVTVNATPPTAGPDSASVGQGSAGNQVVVLGNDSDPNNGSLSVHSVGSAAGGSTAVSSDNLHVVYTPNAGFAGSDSFSYTVRSTTGATATAQVTVTVTPAPLANADTATVQSESFSNFIAVLANDVDTTGGALTVVAVAAAGNGTTALAPDRQQVVYTPAAGFFGSDSFTYTVRSSNGGLAVGQVTVRIANQAPVAAFDTAVVRANSAGNIIAVLANDVDAEGDRLLLTGVFSSPSGSALIAGGSIIYTPAAGFSGQDFLTYTISDGRGGSARGLLAVTVTPPADPIPRPASVALLPARVVSARRGVASFRGKIAMRVANADSVSLSIKTPLGRLDVRGSGIRVVRRMERWRTRGRTVLRSVLEITGAPANVNAALRNLTLTLRDKSGAVSVEFVARAGVARTTRFISVRF